MFNIQFIMLLIPVYCIFRQFLVCFFCPPHGICPRTFGAKPMFARMIYFRNLATRSTHIYLTAKNFRPTNTNSIGGFIMFGQYFFGWFFTILIPMRIEKIPTTDKLVDYIFLAYCSLESKSVFETTP